MKKILIVTPGYLPLLGGMEEQCFLLAKEFKNQGNDVDILTERTQADFLKFEKTEYADVYRIEKPNRRHIFGYIELAAQIIKFIKEHSNYDLIVIRTLTFPGLVLGMLKFLGILKIKTFITAETGGENDELDAIDRSFLKRLYVFVFSQHDFINSITDINFQKFIKLKFPVNKLTRIYNGVECEAYERSEYPEKVSNFLFIAQLRKEKGIYELLEAFRNFLKNKPHAMLFIAGEGPEREGVVDFINKNSLQTNIKYLGRISREEKANFYAKGDCLVLPSYSESFGLVFAEAAVNKRAIIATDVADLKKIYGKNILYCAKRDIEDLENCLNKMMEGYNKGSLDYDEAILKIDIRTTAKQILSLIG